MSRFPTITNEYLQSRERFELSEEEKKSPLAEIFNRPMPKIDQRRLDILNGGMANPQLALKIENRSDMFLPGDQSMEEGYCVMEDGSGFVANRQFFPNATPEMFDWWFSWHSLETIRLAMWFPTEHMECICKDPYPFTDASGISLKTRNWNKEHFPVEGFHGVHDKGDVCIRFFSPEEYGLDMLKVMVSPVKAHAMATCLWMSGLLDFIYGPEKAAKIKTEDPDHKVPFNTFLHTIRPVEGGCELRSRFWVGKTINDGEVVTVDMPEEFDMEENVWLMYRHTVQEFLNLSTFLPEVYNMYHGKVDAPGK